MDLTCWNYSYTVMLTPDTKLDLPTLTGDISPNGLTGIILLT